MSTPTPVSPLSRSPDQLVMSSADIGVQMDPRLQRIIARRQIGLMKQATASSAPNEVSVIAKVSDIAAWENLSEVRTPQVIGKPHAGDKTAIVTGRIPVTRIETIRRLAFVISLKAAQSLQPALTKGVEETNSRQDILSVAAPARGAAGVVVGIIDYGCDFAHRNFLTASGRSRIISIWEQGGQLAANSSVPYGREYMRAQIEAALTQPDPYLALGYGPEPDNAFSKGTHGTHVMDIACGNGLGSGAPGFAPEAELVFVDVSHRDIAFAGKEVVESRFGDSVILLEAVKYIFEKAEDRPCVINISLGTNGGPHDGSTLVEEGIDRLLEDRKNRAVTIAASNSFADGIHASGAVPANGFADLKWRVSATDVTHNELELWYDGAERLTLEVIDPDGISIGTLAPGENGQIANSSGAVDIFAANRVGDPNNGDNVIGVFLENSVKHGVWTMRLLETQGNSVDYHAWIERDDRGPSTFMEPLDNSHTIGSISCGRNTIVVGSYDAHKSKKPVSWFSSAGPTRDGRQKPEISAPGHDVLAAHSRTQSGVVSKSGTSMAAPAVAGIVALIFAQARALGTNLEIGHLRDILTGSARRKPPSGTAWDPQYGHGRIDAAAAITGLDGQAGSTALLAAARTAKKRRPKTKVARKSRKKPRSKTA